MQKVRRLVVGIEGSLVVGMRTRLERRAPEHATGETPARLHLRAMPRTRFDRLDALRGIAIVWMTAFHFCFDLNHFGWIRQDFYRDPVWTGQRTAIVSLFLFCAGLSQAVAQAQAQRWPRFWKRWAQIAGCALLVTAGSYFMFPRSYIFFGVLHGIAVMLVVVRLTARWGGWLWPLGAAAILLPALFRELHAAGPHCSSSTGRRSTGSAW